MLNVNGKQRVKICSGSGAVLACVQQAGGEISDGEMTCKMLEIGL